MDRTKYKNDYNAEKYERVTLSVPKGFKQVIRNLASIQNMSVNAYMLHLVAKEHEGIFDSLQLAERSRNKILTIQGSTEEGYVVYLKDGRTFHCRTKLEVRKCMTADNK